MRSRHGAGENIHAGVLRGDAPGKPLCPGGMGEHSRATEPCFPSCVSLEVGRGARRLGRFESHRVPPPSGGGIKFSPVFSGDMRLGKHTAQGKWGDNSSGIEQHFPCILSQKSLDFCDMAQRFFIVMLRLLTTPGLSRLTTRRCPSASLRLRANPVGLRPPWVLPFAPVHPRGGGVRTLRFFPPIRDRHGGHSPPYAYPSLRSIQPAHDGSALRFFTLNLQTGLLTREGRGGTVCLALEENEC